MKFSKLANSTNYLNENVILSEAKDLNLMHTTGLRVFLGAIDPEFAAEVSLLKRASYILCTGAITHTAALRPGPTLQLASLATSH
jgi:hypothetical protein